MRARVVERVEDAGGVRHGDPSTPGVEGLKATHRDGAGLPYGDERAVGRVGRTRWGRPARAGPGQRGHSANWAHRVTSTWCSLAAGCSLLGFVRSADADLLDSARSHNSAMFRPDVTQPAAPMRAPAGRA